MKMVEQFGEDACHEGCTSTTVTAKRQRAATRRYWTASSTMTPATAIAARPPCCGSAAETAWDYDRISPAHGQAADLPTLMAAVVARLGDKRRHPGC